ncbi:hypothetical protein M419DRAFT_132061 [Trichoderma reesei RUT C-30]|uniref:Uncharacterized protein n=1 Tax=Hypocrea jecorina (strain ATCC 56765 / BCRC 32924 / NRRL 11460 / Rut C-30) TaxID=1344414 RepID=A0A024S733_HYPJR|nr:hypothetical protein M419DRAFT_132061 [Trichoderma reesei RUT C-30]
MRINAASLELAGGPGPPPGKPRVFRGSKKNASCPSFAKFETMSEALLSTTSRHIPILPTSQSAEHAGSRTASF